ncbi:MAG TPA: RdgB/HAM1 family non-canonical purine NTP pyrophosphatase [Steroidobacteraceae bacterium]|jgi:XTP/dITP diphosphohydrolase|nr:RdgB/HAM1 family non-canonical purine NTP pyrophosphatase [Steroidobacteraceae bacterium]
MSARPPQQAHQELVLASANAGKQRELAELLAPLGIRLRLAAEWGLASAPETGTSFQENALLKARHAARATGLPALADDSGLEVDALDGRPGVYSARFAGAHATDEQNNQRLLAELAGRAVPARSARYRCVLAVVRDAEDAAPVLAEGSWQGRIALAAAGSGGFGYDPLFIPDGHAQTVAELPAALKRSSSHRARATAALLAALRAAHWPDAPPPQRAAVP